MADEETLAVYADYAADYAKRFAQDKPDVHLRKFMSALPTEARVLDLGCGTGRTTAFMVRAGLEAEGWDASPEMAQLGKDRLGLEIEVKAFDALVATEVYDGIYANFSLLHAPKADMPKHLDRIAQALKPGGTFHIGMKTGQGEKRDHLGRFYAFYEDAELTGLLADAGLTVVSRETGAEVGLAGTKDPWIIMSAEKDD